jgi:hypothetical protein
MVCHSQLKESDPGKPRRPEQYDCSDPIRPVRRPEPAKQRLWLGSSRYCCCSRDTAAYSGSDVYTTNNSDAMRPDNANADAERASTSDADTYSDSSGITYSDANSYSNRDAIAYSDAHADGKFTSAVADATT